MKAFALFALFFTFNNANADNAACKPGDYKLDPSHFVTVKIGGGGYSPKCLQVLPGTRIEISASGMHPFKVSDDLSTTIDDSARIFDGSTSLVVLDQGFTLQNRKQTLNYYCRNHGSEDGSGMAGSIQVIDN